MVNVPGTFDNLSPMCSGEYLCLCNTTFYRDFSCDNLDVYSIYT